MLASLLPGAAVDSLVDSPPVVASLVIASLIVETLSLMVVLVVEPATEVDVRESCIVSPELPSKEPSSPPPHADRHTPRATPKTSGARLEATDDPQNWQTVERG